MRSSTALALLRPGHPLAADALARHGRAEEALADVIATTGRLANAECVAKLAMRRDAAAFDAWRAAIHEWYAAIAASMALSDAIATATAG